MNLPARKRIVDVELDESAQQMGGVVSGGHDRPIYVGEPGT